MSKNQTPEMRLSLCMIVRDAGRTLGDCLGSIRPWVDEMVVVDTGSVDETAEIARGFGARVFEFPWCDDFAAARNASLGHARGEWVFWMDADDTIDETNGRGLRRLADGVHEESVFGYVMRVHCPGKDGGGDYTAVDQVKMFRNRPELRFEGRIHEQILPAIRRAGGEVAWTELFVTHSGSDQSAEGRRRKYERDLRILELDLRERPEHPFVLFNLGMTYADMGRHEEAVRWLNRSVELANPSESHLRKAYALWVASLQQLGRYGEAQEVCRRGLELCPRDAELLFRQGMLAHEAGRLEEAAGAYRQTLALGSGRYFSSMDQGILGAKARHNLACVYTDMGRPDLAEVQWRRILEESPRQRQARLQLVDSLIRQCRFLTAADELERLDGAETASCEAMLLRVQLAEGQRRLAEAEQWARAAVERFPEAPAAWEALGRFLFEHGEAGEAAEVLGQVVERQPGNGAAWHNLGMAQLRAGRIEAAVESLEQSLRVRPESAATREHWEEAVKRLNEEGVGDDRSLEQEGTEITEEDLSVASVRSCSNPFYTGDNLS